MRSTRITSRRSSPFTALIVALMGAAALALANATPAHAQTWTGAYVGGQFGWGLQRGDASEVVTFDTNLDGTFDDTVRTAAGANAFSPGFCGGTTTSAQPSVACADDENGMASGGRAGYDWQNGLLVVGGLVDVASGDLTDGVSAFSTTPAFYAFRRELRYTTGLRGRVGAGTARVLVYGTGGGAMAAVNRLFTTSNAVNTFVPATGVERSDMAWGYQAGGGAEFRVGSRWSINGEYLFTSLDDRDDGTVRSQGPAPATNPFILTNPSGTDLQRADRFEYQSVRVGLNLRF